MSFAATRKLFVLFFCWTWIPNNSMESDLLVFTNSQPMLSTGPNSTDIELPVKAMDPVKISPNVEFPENAKIFLNATQWARVSEPLVPVNVSSNFRFRITKAVVDVFGVTKKSGIIYLKETNDFKDLISAIHRITVSWNLASKPSVIQSALIDVMLMKADNSTCSNNMTDHTDNFCAKFKTQDQCESSCGVGSIDGRCKWRQGPNKVSKLYSTCSPDLTTCSNAKCDALEFTSYKQNATVCPQDCVYTRNVKNSVQSTVKDRGIGMQNGSAVCSCDDQMKCICEDSTISVYSFSSSLHIPSAFLLVLTSTAIKHIFSS